MPRVAPRVTPLSAATRLQLMWLASPALPVGGFSYSEVLESAIDSGRVVGESQVAAWLRDQLHLSLARADMAVVAKAIPAWQRGDLARISELNAWVCQTRETSELRLQAEQMGRSLVAWLQQRSGHAAVDSSDLRLAHCSTLRPAPTWPVVFALAVAQSLPVGQGSASPDVLREALISFAFAWAENMVQAAIKSVPLGQSAGQRMLARLVRDIPAAVDHAVSLDDDQRQAFTPLLAILSARHETQYSRLFRS